MLTNILYYTESIPPTRFGHSLALRRKVNYKGSVYRYIIKVCEQEMDARRCQSEVHITLEMKGLNF